ncbi:hypothetical protein LguiA_011889 [Lonicera macranthoides]
MKLELGEDFLVWQVFESLPAQFDVLRTSYNAQKNEWSIDEMISILSQEEENVKKKKSLIVCSSFLIIVMTIKSSIRTRLKGSNLRRREIVTLGNVLDSLLVSILGKVMEILNPNLIESVSFVTCLGINKLIVGSLKIGLRRKNVNP